MKYFKFLIGFVSIFFLISCQPTEEAKRTIRPLPEGISLPADAIVYALPRTNLRIEVTAEKILQKKGPFFNYREKYLGLEGGIEEDHSEWIISGIGINSYEDLDPEKYYVIEPAGIVYSNYLQLSNEGLVLSFNPQTYRELPVTPYSYPGEVQHVYFKDLSVKRNVEMSSDTAYRLIETDTAFIRVPYFQKKERIKTLREKAEEAANFIIKIRKRRFKLLSGQYDVFPEGIALEYAVKELTLLENEYLALFLGKTIREKSLKTFEIIPDLNNKSSVLFRFSKESGVLPADDPAGEPINIHIESMGKTDNLVSAKVLDNLLSSELIYRIPELCKVEIMDKNGLLADRKLLICQLGKLIRLPENLYLEPKE